ncbi:hypothetical protein [Thalassotalea crassostreae]|uniref:hypothetical protein n=1 Tax=Thalassotalea crassostreae TaxID=1763536 RepID=UPI000838497B|nr:hypothetical protein [Thalassotalea crassostreae]
MEEKKVIEIGSSPEKAVKGDYKLDVGNIFKEAITITKTNMTPIISGFIMVVLLDLIIDSFAADFLDSVYTAMLSQPQDMEKLNELLPQMFMYFYLKIIIIWPFLIGLEMMGISHSVGIKTRTGFVFSFLKRAAVVSLVGVLTFTMVILGLYLFVIPAIYLAIALSLATPLVIEKNMTPFAAIWLSLRATRFQWFKLLQTYLLLAVVFVFMAIVINVLFQANLVVNQFFIMLLTLVMAPLYYNVKGILYREIFGVRMQVVNKKDGGQDTYFSA